jgi:hypothetical protein
MTPKKIAGAVGGALLTVAVAVVALAPEGGECFTQNVQMPCSDAGALGQGCKPGSLVTVVMERSIEKDGSDALPEGWDAVTKPTPCEKPAEDASKAIAFVPAEKHGFPATIPEKRDPLTGTVEPERQVICPPPPYVLGNAPEGCAEEWGRLQKLKPAEAPLP